MRVLGEDTYARIAFAHRENGRPEPDFCFYIAAV